MTGFPVSDAIVPKGFGQSGEFLWRSLPFKGFYKLFIIHCLDTSDLLSLGDILCKAYNNLFLYSVQSDLRKRNPTLIFVAHHS